MHAHFLFSYSSVRFGKFFSPGRERVEGGGRLRVFIMLVEPPPPGRKHQELRRDILKYRNIGTT